MDYRSVSSSRAPTRTRRSRSTRAPDVFTPPIPGGHGNRSVSSSGQNLQNIPIRTVEAYRGPSSRRPAGFCWLRTTRRSSSGSWPISRAIGTHARLCRGPRRSSGDRSGSLRRIARRGRSRSAAERESDQLRLIYGMSAFGLARQLGIDRKDAQAYRPFFDATRAFVTTWTVLARRLRTMAISKRSSAAGSISGDSRTEPQRRQAAERTSDAPMQGTAADIIKRAMLTVDSWLGGAGLGALMVMQVHDSLYSRWQRQTPTRSPRVCARMEAAAELSVPLLVEAGRGANWDEAH